MTDAKPDYAALGRQHGEECAERGLAELFDLTMPERLAWRAAYEADVHAEKDRHLADGASPVEAIRFAEASVTTFVAVLEERGPAVLAARFKPVSSALH